MWFCMIMDLPKLGAATSAKAPWYTTCRRQLSLRGQPLPWHMATSRGHRASSSRASVGIASYGAPKLVVLALGHDNLGLAQAYSPGHLLSTGPAAGSDAPACLTGWTHPRVSVTPDAALAAFRSSLADFADHGLRRDPHSAMTTARQARSCPALAEGTHLHLGFGLCDGVGAVHGGLGDAPWRLLGLNTSGFDHAH